MIFLFVIIFSMSYARKGNIETEHRLKTFQRANLLHKGDYMKCSMGQDYQNTFNL